MSSSFVHAAYDIFPYRVIYNMLIRIRETLAVLLQPLKINSE